MATDPTPRSAREASAARGARGAAPLVRAAAVGPAREDDAQRSDDAPTARKAGAPAAAARKTASRKTATRKSESRKAAPRRTPVGASTARKTGGRPRAPVGRSLHIGLNAVGAAHYGGWRGELTACEFDAGDMAALARTRGMRASVLLTREATRAAVLRRLHAAARALRAGDLFFLSFSGHGGQLPDVSAA